MDGKKINYQTGFDNYFSSEAIAGALPRNQNSPQQVPMGLYAEQINGHAFTTPRAQNRHSWLYRIKPSVCQSVFNLYTGCIFPEWPYSKPTPPTAMRWDPPALNTKNLDWLHGLQCWASNDSPQQLKGSAVYLYQCNTTMKDYHCNADGEWIILPVVGTLKLLTELGALEVAPEEIAVIPRGIKFQVTQSNELALGYACENYGTALQLPELGVIGANGLAHPRHFEVPTASYYDKQGEYNVLQKFQGHCWQTRLDHSPLDVVAWHGNYVPYKYNFKHFNTINTVSYDHIDPSIFTLLTSPSSQAGVANLDLVIFPPRWLVAEHTFRPPYFHRNVMSELMGLIRGQYDAKAHGFKPGGISIHNRMTPHGPDATTYQSAVKQKQDPDYYDAGIAFMFESRFAWQITEKALNSASLQTNYVNCWYDFDRNFKP